MFKDVDEDDGYLFNKGFVYLSKIEIERYLGSGKKNGEFEWYTIIQSLSQRGIIKYRRVVITHLISIRKCGFLD